MVRGDRLQSGSMESSREWQAMQALHTRLDQEPLIPMPSAWGTRELRPDPDVSYPVERVEVRDPRRGPIAWVGYLAIRAAQATLGRLPRGLRRSVGQVLATVVGRLDRRHTQAALDFVQAAYPQAPPTEHRRLVRAAWLHLWELSLRSPYAARNLLHQPLQDRFAVRGTARALELARSESPVLFVTAHVGHWEVAGIALATLGFAPVYAVAKAPRNDPLSRYMQRSRENQGGRLLPRKEAMKSVPRVLAGGGSVMFLLDHRARSKPVYAPFFGRPAACERSASVLIKRTKVPLCFLACYEGQGEQPYDLVLGPVVEAEDLAGLSPAALSGVINHQFEVMIRRAPEQYFWLHDRFRNTPSDWASLGAKAGPFAVGQDAPESAG